MAHFCQAQVKTAHLCQARVEMVHLHQAKDVCRRDTMEYQ
jgi:hypothetical protein